MPLQPSSYKRQLMGAAFARDAEIDASLHPLRTMGGQTASTMPMLGQKMGKLVKQGFLHLFLGNGAQRRIEPDLRSEGYRHTRGGAHTEIPTHNQQWG